MGFQQDGPKTETQKIVRQSKTMFMFIKIIPFVKVKV